MMAERIVALAPVLCTPAVHLIGCNLVSVPEYSVELEFVGLACEMYASDLVGYLVAVHCSDYCSHTHYFPYSILFDRPFLAHSLQIHWSPYFGIPLSYMDCMLEIALLVGTFPRNWHCVAVAVAVGATVVFGLDSVYGAAAAAAVVAAVAVYYH